MATPTELIFALCASHVIVTSDFLNASLADRAKRNVVCFWSCMLSWPNNLLKHCYTTAILRRKVIVQVVCTTTASPTELVFAHSTGHVIATTVFLNASLANRAAWNFVLVFIDPLLQILAHDFIALNLVTMPLLATLKAHLSFAWRTL